MHCGRDEIASVSVWATRSCTAGEMRLHLSVRGLQEAAEHDLQIFGRIRLAIGLAARAACERHPLLLVCALVFTRAAQIATHKASIQCTYEFDMFSPDKSSALRQLTCTSLVFVQRRGRTRVAPGREC